MKTILMALLLSWQLTAHASTPAEMAPEQVTGAITINTATAKLLFDKGYLFVDVRKLEDFNQGHIPGAQHLAVNSALFTASNLAVLADKDQVVVFYCNGIHCLGSSKASKQAAEWGWRKIFYYREGFPKWKEAGYAVENLKSAP